MICNLQPRIFAVAACSSVHCTVYSVFLCLLLVSDDSPLTEPSELMVARVAFGKSSATHCQVFVPIHCVWLGRGGGGLPWHLAALLPPPCFSKTTMIRRDGWGRGVLKSYSDSLLVEPEPFNMFLKILPNEDKQWEHCINKHRPGV